VLLQNSKPVAYACRALTDAKTQYAQIEKELLAVVFAFNKFHHYTYGKEVTVESEHKPLEIITKKKIVSSTTMPAKNAPTVATLHIYNGLQARQGDDLADTLSCAYLHTQKSFNEDIVCAVNSVINNLPISDPKLELACASNPTMVNLQSTITSGWPENRSEVSRPYWNFRDELSTAKEIILKGEKVAIPHSLRKEMLDKIHTAHLGIVKSKKRAKDVLFWPGMSRDIKIARLHSTSSKSVIKHTKSVFAQHSIPRVVKSDNGPQYTLSD